MPRPPWCPRLRSSSRPLRHEIVAGPIGATGPDGVTDHSFQNILTLVQNFAAQQVARSIDPIGLDPQFPGLHGVFREGDPSADLIRQPCDFYSPDTFNYAVIDVDACPPMLTVSLYGVNSYAVNTLPQPAVPSAVRKILSFSVDAESPCAP